MTDPRNNVGDTRIFITPIRSRQGTIELAGRYTQSPDNLSEPRKKWTQVDQDHEDDKVHQQALDVLIQSWKERLSLISVITTFFAAMEAQLLGSTAPQGTTRVPPIEQAANAGLMGALVVHVFAAIISFLAAFFLIRYKLREATKQELKAEEATSTSTPDIFSRNPHLEQVGPFSNGQPPTNLLRRCHSLCMWLAAVGFVLALMGIICFAWALMPTTVSVFSSVCAGVCFVAGIAAIL